MWLGTQAIKAAINICFLSLVPPAFAQTPGTGGGLAIKGHHSKSGNGYFVLSYSQVANGNFGGLVGANSFCVNDLTSYNWIGKSDAGVLTSGRVRAFLCDSSSCQNLRLNQTYAFAVSNSLSVGGATFATNSSGQGPGNSSSWAASTYFGGAIGYPTGRAKGSTTLWSNSPGTFNCSNWTSAATQATAGGAANSDDSRWSLTSAYGCNASYKIICIVDP